MKLWSSCFALKRCSLDAEETLDRTNLNLREALKKEEQEVLRRLRKQ
jgi:hypothetical protein